MVNKRDVINGVMADMKEERQARDKALKDYVSALFSIDKARQILSQYEQACEQILSHALDLGISKKELELVKKATVSKLQSVSEVDHE